VDDDSRIRVVLAKIRGQTYASITYAGDLDGERQYLLMRYEFRGPDRFVVFWPSEALHTAIERQEIPGRIVEDHHLPYLRLEADADRLRKFVSKHGKRMFGKPGPVFDRIP
jgi:hypothetical protein